MTRSVSLLVKPHAPKPAIEFLIRRVKEARGKNWRTLIVRALARVRTINIKRDRWSFRNRRTCRGSVGRIMDNVGVCEISGRGSCCCLQLWRRCKRTCTWRILGKAGGVCRRGFNAIRIRGVLLYNSNIRGIRGIWSYSSSKCTTVKIVMMKSMWICEDQDSTKCDGEEKDRWKEHGRIGKEMKVKTWFSLRKKGGWDGDCGEEDSS